jgi:hypothetical protein
MSAPSLALANWAATHLPVGAHVAADRDNGILLDDIASVDTVTAIGGLVDPAPLYFGTEFTPFDRSLIRQGDIRYVVVDSRLTEGLPLYGTYIAAGESTRPVRLTPAQLDKIASVPGVRRIYDNGPIQVYDVSAVLGKPPLPPPTDASRAGGGRGADVGVLLVAVPVAVLWATKLYRRRKRPVDSHVVVCGIVGAMVVGLFGAGLLLLAPVSPEPVVLAILTALLVVGLRSKEAPDRTSGGHPPEPQRATTRSGSPAVEQSHGRDRRRRTQLVLGCAGLALFGLAAVLATTAAHREWVPPPELSLSAGAGGQPVAGVELGSAPVVSRLELVTGGRVVWTVTPTRASGPQQFPVPRRLVGPDARLRLVSGGHVLRQIGA